MDEIIAVFQTMEEVTEGDGRKEGRKMKEGR
jgi:hypothetical protein